MSRVEFCISPAPWAWAWIELGERFLSEVAETKRRAANEAANYCWQMRTLYHRECLRLRGPIFGEHFHDPAIGPAGVDRANTAALRQEDPEADPPPDRRTFGGRLQEGFAALHGEPER